MSRRPPHLRALVRSAAPTRDIPPDVRARSAKRVAKLAAVPFALSVWSAWGKAALAAVLVAAVGAAGLVASRAQPTTTATPARRTATARTTREPPPAPRPEARALATPPPAPVQTPLARAMVHAPVARSVAPAPERAVAPAATPVVLPAAPPVANNTVAPSTGLAAAPPSAHNGLLGELALVGEAQAALARDPEAVLAIAARHRAEYPGGHLLEESEFLSLDALHRLGRREAFAARADDFLRAHPRGPYAERVRRWIDSHSGD